MEGEMTGEGRPSGRRAMAAYDKVTTTGPGQELPLAVGQEGEVHRPGGGDLMRTRGRGKAGKGEADVESLEGREGGWGDDSRG